MHNTCHVQGKLAAYPYASLFSLRIYFINMHLPLVALQWLTQRGTNMIVLPPLSIRIPIAELEILPHPTTLPDDDDPRGFEDAKNLKYAWLNP